MTTQKSIDEWLFLAFEDVNDCPPPELFLKAEWEKLTPEERQSAELHAESCSACAAERDLARAFDLPVEWTDQAEDGLRSVLAQIGDDRASATDLAASRPHEGRLLRFPGMAAIFSRQAFGLAAAAVALLAVGLVVQTRSLAPPELPDAPRGDVTRGGRVEVVAPRGELGETPDMLHWHVVDGAGRYEVTLTAVDEAVLWRGSSSMSQLELPEKVRSTLHPSVVYFWQVEAFDNSGSRIAWSARTRFLVAQAPIEGALIKDPS